MSRDLVVATRNAHKLREIRQILGELPEVRVLGLREIGLEPLPEEEGIETHDTFAANALAKARYFAARTGRVVLADDSGLCVDALGGRPGVRSRRFAEDAGGEGGAGGDADAANNELLLRLLAGVPAERRGAHYVCVVALADPAGREAVFAGRCDGEIVREPRGSEGFGYDPLFRVSGEGGTLGELSPEAKNRVSHRARAMRAAAGALGEWLGSRPVDSAPGER